MASAAGKSRPSGLAAMSRFIGSANCLEEATMSCWIVGTELAIVVVG